MGHALEHLLRPDELDRWELRWVCDERGQWQLVGEVHARGEQYRGFITELGAGYAVADGLDVFTDGLEDSSQSRGSREGNGENWTTAHGDGADRVRRQARSAA